MASQSQLTTMMLDAKEGLLTAEQAYAVLGDKLSSRFSTVRRAFLLNKGGGRGDGFIDRREFRDALERINIKMTGEEFRKLWKTFDVSGDGKINYLEFNNLIGPLVSPPAMGLQLNRPDTPRVKEWQKKAVARTLRKKLTNIEQTYKDIDTDGSGRISHAEFIQALRKLGVRSIGDTESWSMMMKYKKPSNTTADMTFEEFKECMVDYMKIDATGLEADEAPSEALKAAMDAIEKAAKGQSVESISSHFAKHDKDARGEVDYSQFKAGLQSLGVHLSKDQMFAICKKYDPLDDGGIYYRELAMELVGDDGAHVTGDSFATYKNLADMDLAPVVNPITGKPYSHEELTKRVAPRLGVSEAELRLVYSTLGRKETLKDAFMRFDANKDGRLTPTEMKRALDQLGVDVTEELITVLFAKYDSNHDGTIDFDELNSRLGGLMTLSEANFTRLMLAKSGPGKAFAASTASSSAAAVEAKPATPSKALPRGLDEEDRETVATVNMDLAPTAQKMRKVLGRHWTTVLADVKKASGSKGAAATAGSPASAVRDTLAKHGVPLTSKEVRALSMRYHAGGPVATRDAEGVIDVDSMLKDMVISAAPNGAAATMSKSKTFSPRRSPSPTKRR